MENSSIADAVIANRGLNFAGNGYGYGGFGGGGNHIGNQVLAAEAHANGTAIGAKIDNTSQKIEDQADFTREIISNDMAGIRQSFDSSTRSAEFNNIKDVQFRTELRSSEQHAQALAASAAVEARLRDGHSAISKDIIDQEFRSLDRQRDIERTLVQNAKDAAECCSETQKLILSEGNETRAVILAVEGRANLSALAAANAKVTQLETINALQGPHRGN